MFAGCDRFDPYLVLDLKNQGGLQRLQNTRCSGFLPLLDVPDEVLVCCCDEVDSATGADGWGKLAIVDAAVEHENTAGAWPTEKLVRGDENRIDTRITFVGFGRIHVDVDIGSTRRIVEAGDCIVPVKES